MNDTKNTVVMYNMKEDIRDGGDDEAGCAGISSMFYKRLKLLLLVLILLKVKISILIVYKMSNNDEPAQTSSQFLGNLTDSS